MQQSFANYLNLSQQNFEQSLQTIDKDDPLQRERLNLFYKTIDNIHEIYLKETRKKINFINSSQKQIDASQDDDNLQLWRQFRQVVFKIRKHNEGTHYIDRETLEWMFDRYVSWKKGMSIQYYDLIHQQTLTHRRKSSFAKLVNEWTRSIKNRGQEPKQSIFIKNQITEQQLVDLFTDNVIPDEMNKTCFLQLKQKKRINCRKKNMKSPILNQQHYITPGSNISHFNNGIFSEYNDLEISIDQKKQLLINLQ